MELVRSINVDDVPRHQLPSFLKSVPTLYIPETKDVLVGQAIYAYIAKPVSRREVPVAAAGQTIATQGAPQQSAPGGGEPAAWGFSGGGLTESFSDWGKPGQFTHSDQLQYTYLGGMAATPAPSSGGGTEPKNIQQRAGGDDIASRLEQMRSQRDKEFTGITRQ